MTKPCVVCDFPVEIGKAEKRTYIDPDLIAQGVEKKNVLVVCGSKRCQRLVNEVIAEAGKRRVR